MRFLGITPASLACLEWAAGELHQVDVRTASGVDEILAWVTEFAPGPAGIGVDARSTGLSEALLQLGFIRGEHIEPRQPARFQIAVDADRMPGAIPCAYAAAQRWYGGENWTRYLAGLRENYGRGGLLESEMDRDPLSQFETWFAEARAAGLKEPNAMTLATASANGQPSARIVLLKGLDERGFVFYTNYESRKGQDLAANPRAALLFYWAELERQVRIVGRVTRVAVEESEAYFHSRPQASQIGAWASRQSEVTPSRDLLEQRFEELRARYEGKLIPLPPFWGGYRVYPESIEFWQGRPGRMHDRLRYSRYAGGGWQIERLSP